MATTMPRHELEPLAPAPQTGQTAQPAPPAPNAAPTAPGDWVQQHARAVQRFVRVLGAAPAVADDLTQEAFAVAWHKQKHLLPAPALRTFLLRTVKLLWLEQSRDRRREARALAAVAERMWQRECGADGGDAFVAAVHDCMARLAPRARDALRRVHAEQDERAAVAAELGLSPNGLKTLLQRARQLVLACVARRHERTRREEEQENR